MSHTDIKQLLNRELIPGEYEKIRELWKAHSIAEDNHNIEGLIATLTEDCEYRLVQTGNSWKGHSGAADFYTTLLTAFPDIHFDLQNIVIGPQGVMEEAHVTGTHRQQWLNFPATGNPVEFDVVIFFPWDREQQKFQGERIFFFGLGGVIYK